MSHDERGPWYLITGLVVGAIFGLLFAWIAQPVKYVDTAPVSLRRDFKDSYRALIASAYVGNPDLVRAKARLKLLQDADPFRALSEQAQRTLAEKDSANDARALGLLAVALESGSSSSPILIVSEFSTTAVSTRSPASIQGNSPTSQLEATHTKFLQNSATLTPESTQTIVETITPAAKTIIPSQFSPTTAVIAVTQTIHTSTNTPRMSLTPTFTLIPTNLSGSNYVLLSQEKICTTPLAAPLFQIEVTDASGKPLTGVLVIVNWDSGEDRFFTGLKPDKGLGYADYNPSPDIVYLIRLGETGQPAKNLIAPECISPFGERFWGSWLLSFVQI